MGQGRGGFYSFDAVENAIGCGIHSVDEVLPEHQELRPGDVVRAGRDTYPCWTVMAVDPPHHLVLQGSGTPAQVEVPEVVDEVPDRDYVASTWQWVLRPVDDGRRTRLIVRQRCTYSPNQAVLWHVVEPLNYVMEREMLRGVAARAEHLARSGAAPTGDAVRVAGPGALDDTLTEVLRDAVRAPSSHNAQPWRFEVRDGLIELHVDRSRRLPAGDPDDRELLIGCGTALANLQVSAERRGWEVELELTADDADGPIASLRWREGDRTADDHDGLAGAMHRRRTHRGGFEDRRLDDAVLAEVLAAANADGVWAVAVDDPDRRRRLAELVHAGDALQWADRGWRRELARWMRPASSGDGLTVPAAVAPVAHAVVGRVDLGALVGRRDATLTVEAPTVVAIGTEEDTRASRVRCGIAVERALLAAARHGVQAGWSNQPCQVRSLRPAVAELLGRPHPQLVLRLGHPPVPAEPSPRRPLEELVTVVA
jgi:nitroreductase